MSRRELRLLFPSDDVARAKIPDALDLLPPRLRRIVQASSRRGDRVLDFFAGSGTTGAVASALGRDAVLVDHNPEAIAVMRERMPHARVVTEAGR